VIAVLVILFVERTAATIMLGGFLALLILLSFYRAKRAFSSQWLEKFTIKRERPGAFPLSGAVFFFLGVLCAFLLYQPLYAAAATAVLAVGDSVSTVAGKIWGRHKLPFDGGRSWEGSLAFFAFSAAILLLFVRPEKALVAAFLTALVEMLPKLDDNFTVPIAAGLFLTLL
jgi:dolichol kinase